MTMLSVPAACALPAVPWWAIGVGVVLTGAAVWTLWREFHDDPQAKRVIAATVVALLLATGTASADIIYGPNCREDFWRGVCGDWWCTCAWLNGCDCESNPGNPG